MTRWGLMVGLVFCAVVTQTNAFCEEGGPKAERIASNASINTIGSRGAVQVAQVHTQAHTELLVLLVQQNDQIIALLKELVDKKTEPTAKKK